MGFQKINMRIRKKTVDFFERSVFSRTATYEFFYRNYHIVLITVKIMILSRYRYRDAFFEAFF